MVKVIKTRQELESLRITDKRSIGFVPTMGNLHQGHISLLEQALEENECAYFSIFVNPKQFGPNEDFSRYPRTLEEDLQKIETCSQKYPLKDVIVFAPHSPAEVFPNSEMHIISVPFLNSILEGAIRPGHFDGVTTVVYKLFNLVQPKRAYFGLKDYQQFIIIRKMTKDLLLPIEIIGMPIVRENDGLAMSSRNQYLDPDQRLHSLILNKALKKLQEMISGRRENIKQAENYKLELLKDPNWNYIEIRDSLNLSSDISHSKEISILAVYQLGTTRLLDNIQVELK
jgi:pantoate--beta-alanine ligase